jgi:N-acetylated-alpha-linked acidic dipeptidase
MPFFLNGISSLTFGFAPGPADPVFHWHSDYDTVEWVDRYGDPTWGHHVASAQVWALTAARLVDDPIIPFNVTAYALALDGYLEMLRQEFEIESRSDGPPTTRLTSSSPCSLDLKPLDDAISRLLASATAFDAVAEALREHPNSNSNLDLGQEITNTDKSIAMQIDRVNSGYGLFERSFIYTPNSPGARSQHIIYSPSSFRSDLPAFPELTRGIREKDWCDSEVSANTACLPLI